MSLWIRPRSCNRARAAAIATARRRNVLISIGAPIKRSSGSPCGSLSSNMVLPRSRMRPSGRIAHASSSEFSIRIRELNGRGQLAWDARRRKRRPAQRYRCWPRTPVVGRPRVPRPPIRPGDRRSNRRKIAEDRSNAQLRRRVRLLLLLPRTRLILHPRAGQRLLAKASLLSVRNLRSESRKTAKIAASDPNILVRQLDVKPRQLQLPRSGPDGQPIESSQLEQNRVAHRSAAM